jgi:glycerol kinase
MLRDTAEDDRARTVLAIDAGTTGITALLVDERAAVRAIGYREFPQHFPHEGWVEHDLGEVWSATIAAVTDVLDQVADRPHLAPEAVGITNQRETICLWDRDTLGAARRAIVWQDRRSADLCDALRSHEPYIVARTGLRLDPYFSATKLTWLAQEEPHIFGQLRTGRLAIGTIDSYLIARMTRGVQHVTDHTNASRTLLYDVETGGWSPDLCALFGVPTDALPEIVASYGVVGHTDPRSFCGLDLPVAGIAGDQQAALVGQACFSAGEAKCTYGTGSFLLVNTGTTIARSEAGLLTTVALSRPDGTRTFALEGAVFVTGAAVQWLRDGLGIIESAAETEQLAASVPDSGGVVFVPALTGLGAPRWDPHARGTILGITRGTTRAHLVRATLDAIAFSVRDVAHLMEHDGGFRLPRLAVDGGAAANDLLCQVQADQLAAPIERPAELQSTGLGAAFLAGLGIGLWSDDEEVATSRRVERTFTPRSVDPSAYQRWHRAVERSLNWAQ